MANIGIQQGATGKQVGQVPVASAGEFGEVLVSELQARFYQQTQRGNVFSFGSSVAALSANTITLTATTTPILGVWNKGTSPVNVVPLVASLTWFPNTFTTPAAPGAFVWAASTGNNGITIGTAPFNRKTLASSGSQALGFSSGVALTGLTNNLVIFEGSDIESPGTVAYGTLPGTAVIPLGQGTQIFDGSLIVPPGGVLALLNTVSTTAFSVAGRLVWMEIPL